MTTLKKIIGAIALPVLWVWAWLSQPRERNKDGLR